MRIKNFRDSRNGLSRGITDGLLKQIDRYAKAKGMKRSEVITEGLRMVLAKSA